MTTTPIDPDISRVLALANLVYPDEYTDANITIADNMLHRANGNVTLAAAYFRAYRSPTRPT